MTLFQFTNLGVERNEYLDYTKDSKTSQNPTPNILNVDEEGREIWSYLGKNGRMFTDYSGKQQIHTAGKNLDGKVL